MLTMWRHDNGEPMSTLDQIKARREAARVVLTEFGEQCGTYWPRPTPANSPGYQVAADIRFWPQPRTELIWE
jgi:hypothetical protein